MSFPVSWHVALEMGYPLDDIELLTTRTERLSAGDLVERLMDYYDDPDYLKKREEKFKILEQHRIKEQEDMEYYRASLERKHIKEREEREKNEKEERRLALVKSTLELLQSIRCRLCNIHERDIICLPCKHYSLCHECIYKTDFCPECCLGLEDYVKVYRS